MQVVTLAARPKDGVFMGSIGLILSFSVWPSCTRMSQRVSAAQGRAA